MGRKIVSEAAQSTWTDICNRCQNNRTLIFDEVRKLNPTLDVEVVALIVDAPYDLRQRGNKAAHPKAAFTSGESQVASVTYTKVWMASVISNRRFTSEVDRDSMKKVYSFFYQEVFPQISQD